MVEVSEGIHRIEIPLADRYVCSYVCVGQRALVVDTGIAGSPREHILPALGALSVVPERVAFAVTTHADMDHLGGNGGLRDAVPGCVLACHALDRVLIEDRETLISRRYRQFEADHGIVDPDAVLDWMRENTETAPVDLELVGGERFRLGPALELEVLHTPGHSKGHVSLYAESRRAAIVADSVLGAFVPSADGLPSLPPTYRDVDEYLATIRALELLDLRLLLTGHYAVLEGQSEIHGFLEESRAFAERLEREILEALDGVDAGLSTRELIDLLSPRVGTWPEAARDMLAFPLVGHLERLEGLGRVGASREGGVLRWHLRTSDPSEPPPATSSG